MGMPDGLSRRLVEEKSRIDANFFNERQLLNLENDDVGKEEDVEDVDLEVIEVATCEKKNGLWVVP